MAVGFLSYRGLCPLHGGMVTHAHRRRVVAAVARWATDGEAGVNVFDRATLQDPVLFAYAVGAVMRRFDPTHYRGYARRQRTQIRGEVVTLLGAVRDRRGVFISYDYECAMWGFPDAVTLIDAEYDPERTWLRRYGQLGVRMAGDEDEYVPEMGLDHFSVTVITAPHDGQIDRF